MLLSLRAGYTHYLHALVIVFVFFNCIPVLYASGFRLPEQSLNGTALNSAYVAGAYGADATYYNPANMSLGEDSDTYEFELDGQLIVIPGFDFDTEGRDKGTDVYCLGSGLFASLACTIPGFTNKDTTHFGHDSSPYRASGSAKTTVYPVPKFFFKSRSYHLPFDLKMNYGFSFTTPSGLALDWDGEGGAFLDDVSIAMLEFNPVVSIAWRDVIAFGAGFRALYSTGSFNNTLYVPISYSTSQGLLGVTANIDVSGTTKVEQTSNGKAWGFGYNLALSVRPFALFDIPILRTTTIAVTYRNKIHQDITGTLSAVSYFDTGNSASGEIYMDADLVLYSDLPTILNVAISQDIGNFRIEFVYERTFYGSAQIFEFGYSNQRFSVNCTSKIPLVDGCNYINPSQMLDAADYSAVAYGNGWKDANAYRLGLTYFGKSYKLMASFAFDGTPAPQGTFGIPDADAYMVGFGARKKLFNSKLDIGIAYSLALKDNRKSIIVSHDGWGQLHLLTMGAKLLW